MVVVAPSTATTGAAGLAEVALDALRPGEVLPTGSRVVVSRLGGPDAPSRRGRWWGWAARTNCCRALTW